MTWIAPAQLPEIHEQLTGPIYEKVYAAAVKTENADREKGGPSSGAEISKVEPGSPAEKLGLHIGDIVMSLDSRPVHGLPDWTAGRAAAQESQMGRFWIKSTGQEKLILLPIGNIGVTANSFFQLDRAYVLSLPPNEKPSDDVLVAIAEQSGNPIAAETALSHARAAGNKSPIIDFIQTLIDFNELRFDDAVAFGMQAMQEIPDDAFRLAPCVHTAALATFHWKLAMDLEKRFPNEFIKTDPDDDSQSAIADAVGEFEKMPVDAMTNPIEAFTKLKFQDHSTKPNSPGMPTMEASEFTAKSFRQNHSADFAAADGNYANIALGPAGKNVDFGITCHFKATGSRHGEYAKALLIGLVDKKTLESPCTLQIETSGTATLFGARHSALYDVNLLQVIKDDHRFKVHAAAVGNRCEIVIDGSRVYYGPELHEETTRNLVAFMKVVGVKGTFSELTWRTAGAGNH